MIDCSVIWQSKIKNPQSSATEEKKNTKESDHSFQTASLGLKFVYFL